MKNDLLNRLKNLPKGQLLTIVLVVVGFFVLLDLNSRLSLLYQRRQDVQSVSTEVVSLYATEVYLRTEMAKMNNVQKLEEFGRGKRLYPTRRYSSSPCSCGRPGCFFERVER